jgi:hypothetical protein
VPAARPPAALDLDQQHIVDQREVGPPVAQPRVSQSSAQTLSSASACICRKPVLTLKLDAAGSQMKRKAFLCITHRS